MYATETAQITNCYGIQLSMIDPKAKRCILLGSNTTGAVHYMVPVSIIVLVVFLQISAAVSFLIFRTARY